MKCSETARIAAKTCVFMAAWAVVLAGFLSPVFALQAPETAAPPSVEGSTGSNPPQQVPAPSPPTPQVPATASTTRPMNCPHPADPHRRHTGCKDEDFDWDEALSKDWNGIRAALRKVGISPSVSYTGALQTNATGGPHQIWGYAGQLAGGLNVDLQRLLKIPGMSLYLGGSVGSGDNLSGSLHNLLAVNSLYAPSYYLGEMYLQQVLFKQNLTLVGGRIAASNTFAALPVFNNYVNYAINPNSVPLGINDITFLSPPSGTEWGAQATYNLTTALQASAGLFNTNLNAANGQNHGTDWTLQQGNKGALVAAQIAWFPHGISAEQGKQGEYTVGVITNNNSLPSVYGNAPTREGYAGAFLMGQEMVYQPDGPNTTRGLTVWGSWAYNSRPLISFVPLFWGAGASYQGLIPTRKDDAASVAWIYGGVSSSIPGTSAEQVLEANYRWLYRRFLVLTPDFQYIWKPSGYDVPGIAVFGVQVALTF
jgi:porin